MHCKFLQASQSLPVSSPAEEAGIQFLVLLGELSTVAAGEAAMQTETVGRDF